MDDEKRCDLLKDLADDRWREFELKAQQEWKLSLSIWTVFAIAAASLLKGEARNVERLIVVVVGFPVVLLVGLCHASFLLWVRTRMNQIRASMEEIDEQRRKLAGVDKADQKAGRSRLNHVPMYVQVAITVLLGLVLLFMLVNAA